CYINNIVLQTSYTRLYSQSGILSSEGFFSEAFSKMGHFVLPSEFNPLELRDILGRIFYKKSDYIWIAELPNHSIELLMQSIFSADKTQSELLLKHFRKGLIKSAKVLTYQITGTGLHSLIMDRFQTGKGQDSPFFNLNREIITILETLENKEMEGISSDAYKEIVRRISSCEGIIYAIREEQRIKGADLALTYLLQSLYQRVNRVRALLKLLFVFRQDEMATHVIDLYKELIKSECQKHSLKDFITKNIGFLAYQITEHAGKTGDHYITHNRKEYWKMLRSSMGGGLIVGFLSCFKVGLYYLKLAPFWEAFAYSMNYSLGFIGIHMTHSTLATKQPAMTATKIASSLDVEGSVSDALRNLSALIVKVFRSQFVAFMGNILIAFPVAFALSWLFFMVFDGHIAGTVKAEKLISELHPWKSLSLFHAGIAGVCLFLSGIISGYYDNAVVFRKIPLRLRQHPFLIKTIPTPVLQKLSYYVENNLGSLAGNFFLGIFLGSMGTLGFILGLPIDIRHITFASGNFGLAMASLGSSVDWQTILITVVGILGIGVMNFVVSFGLAIFVAIESRGVAFTKTTLLINYLLRSFWRKPLEFFFPPAEKIETVEKAEGE
ncbi:MAG: hypothetical protein WD334_11715, partial [Chitinophagales bacterium]